MPMGMINGFRVVDEQVLLKWWRERMDSWPPHQYRLRAMRLEDERQRQELESERPPTSGGTLPRA